jgi:acetyl-CoA carboxylase carboxyl transferase subunit alpha
MEHVSFEKPIVDLELKIDELRRLAARQAIDLDSEISELEERAQALRRQMFSGLGAYEITQLARHPKRPTTIDLIDLMCSDFIELHGDRNFFDDPAIVGGIARIEGRPVMIIGHQRGRDTKENIKRNFGMPRPDGYRKALRLMNIAERFGIPIVNLIDTKGAYPGVDAEERGQAEAIAKNILVMFKLKIPMIVIVIGEGGSGGALAIGVGNRIHMLQYSIYSVISPEGCASILMRDASKAPQMAEQLKLTAAHALRFGVIDSVIPEPEGGAHRNHALTAERVKAVILEDLDRLSSLSGETLQRDRYDKFMGMGPLVRLPLDVPQSPLKEGSHE